MSAKDSRNDTIVSIYPDFIEKRLLQSDEELFKPRKNNKPLCLGNHLPDENSIMLQSNDYLNISNHPLIRNAQLEALARMKREPVMSGVFLHESSDLHLFERKMAAYAGYESAILCQSGWKANVGLLQIIADSEVPVYVDFFAHMSLWEGVRIAGAKAYPFRHNDPDHLDRLIREHGQGIVIIDSLYSTLGDIAPLVAIIDVTSRYNCVTVVDESHSLGIYGKHGSGLVSEYGLTDRVDFVTASLAKAFAGRAGIIFSSARFAKYFPFMAYPAIFSSTLLLHEIVGLSATLEIIRHSDERRQALSEKSFYFRQGLAALGYNFVSQSQIVSIESGLESDTELFRDALEEQNVFGSVFLTPATPKNRTLMRFSLHSDLKKEELDYTLKVCEEIRDEIGMWNWKSTKKRKSA